MSLRLSHLTTLTISLTWVARFTLPSTRCERSPNPVIVGVNTFARSFADGRPRAASTSRRARRRARARRSWARRSAPLLVCRPKRLRSRRLPHSPARRGGSSLRRWLWSSCPPYALFVVLLAQSYLGRVRSSRTARTEKWVGMLGLAALPGHPAPVDNWDNRAPSRQRPARAYTGRSSESPGRPHALSASVSRRTARAASGFGGRRAARAAQEGGA